MWQRLRQHIDDIDPDRLHLRIGVIVTAGVTLAVATLYLTPLWPAQVVWAGLMPVMFGVTFLVRPPELWPLTVLLSFAVLALVVGFGSASEPTSPWYILITGLTGLVCGLGLGFEPYWGTMGVLAFALYAASSNMPGGLEAVPERWAAMALAAGYMSVLTWIVRWPSSDPVTTAQRRLYARLVKALDGAAHRQALTLQPPTYALWQALRRRDSEEADQVIRRYVILRNAVILLAETEARAIEAGVAPSRLAACADSRKITRDILQDLAAGLEVSAKLDMLDDATARGRQILTVSPSETIPIARKLRRSEAIYALEAIRISLHDEVANLTGLVGARGHHG